MQGLFGDTVFLVKHCKHDDLKPPLEHLFSGVFGSAICKFAERMTEDSTSQGSEYRFGRTITICNTKGTAHLLF